tara:strand:+ start:200 stop:517 length:318 start_codon:yes stop_codon:yes gene_type:complete
MTNKPKPNGQTTLTSDDWDLIINSTTDFPYEIFDDKKVSLDESLFEEYLKLLKAGELLPNTTFEMFEKSYHDFDTDILSRLKKRIEDQNKKEGIASLFMRMRGLA